MLTALGSPRRRRLITLIAVLALLVVGCGDDDEPSTTTSTTTDSSTTVPDATSTTTDTTDAPTSTPSTTSTTSTSEPAGVESYRVYFAWNEKVGTAGRSAAVADAETAMEALLAGPDDFETDIGMGSEIPAGTVLNGVTVADRTATVDLSSAFESGGGSLSMSLRVAQVVFTLTQFGDVDEVDIRLDGEAVDAIGGEGVPASDLDRTDFRNETPFVLVESPTPGEAITSPVTITGYSNTFEGTVVFEITDGDGLIVAEGFTTSSGGNGVWGEFSHTMSFTPERPGIGAVIAFQESADTGAPIDVYEVPVGV